MDIDRRKFLEVASVAGFGMLDKSPSASSHPVPKPAQQTFDFRIAFDVWINDVRNEAMPLENWPYGVLDDKTVDGIVRALDIQSESGYTAADLCGLWTTYAWPIPIDCVVDSARERRINLILRAAHERKMKVICFPSGILNWGFDDIIKKNPDLRTDNGSEMNPLREESWNWLYQVFDYVGSRYDVDGFHLEAADQGRCGTPECLEKWPDNVAYYCHLTGKLADYLRQKYPGKLLVTTIQGFSTWGKGFTDRQTGYIVDLSKKVDCLIDQGHRGTYVPPAEWKEFIPKLHCAYGTSGGFWVYPPQRWVRSRWFLPYPQRTGTHMKELYEAGGRGVMYYQGPVLNPSTEVNIAFGGRMMTDISKSIEDTLAETLEHLYRPRNSAALHKLVEIYQRAESVYFDQWNSEIILAAQKAPEPGELYLTNLFGSTPGAATYLLEPYLDGKGRLSYKSGLIEILKDILTIGDDFDDEGRIGRIKEGIGETLVDINNIATCKNEKQVWDDQTIGLGN